jgi:hypothetical protein
VGAAAGIATDHPLSTTAWTDLVIDLNTSTHVVTYYANGVSFGTNTYNAASLLNMSFEVRNAPATVNTLYVDDLWYGTQAVPEPSSFMALGMFGLGALGFIKRRRA